ncbi:hypothetical protein CWI38_1042p0010 [Hamiltosporidium tvaerminnensis]|uniref:Uncharacterized protein n=1 Tax=Hamiltosporidium tvaerminnensis TaxID=1176355 RepID=A0A4Q9LU96_9MICR|nr:hypothetical protein CWI38_1042p0010 [Hamiltosporidium tvaerminnensis]
MGTNPCCRKPEVRNYFLSSESLCNDNSEKESLNVNIVLSQEDKKEECACKQKSPSCCSEQKPIAPPAGNLCFHMNVIGDSAGKPEEEEPEEEPEEEDEAENPGSLKNLEINHMEQQYDKII